MQEENMESDYFKVEKDGYWWLDFVRQQGTSSLAIPGTGRPSEQTEMSATHWNMPCARFMSWRPFEWESTRIVIGLRVMKATLNINKIVHCKMDIERAQKRGCLIHERSSWAPQEPLSPERKSKEWNDLYRGCVVIRPNEGGSCHGKFMQLFSVYSVSDLRCENTDIHINTCLWYVDHSARRAKLAIRAIFSRHAILTRKHGILRSVSEENRTCHKFQKRFSKLRSINIQKIIRHAKGVEHWQKRYVEQIAKQKPVHDPWKETLASEF
jgi:hypothetical protein